MTKNVTPLHEALRPNCHPDQAGDIGQEMFALADWIEKNQPSLHVNNDFTAQSLATAVLDAIPLELKQNSKQAIDYVSKLDKYKYKSEPLIRLAFSMVRFPHMITPSHMIYSWALAKATDPQPNKLRTLAFVAGGLIPDLPTYTFFFVHTFLLGTSQQLMWDTLYFDSAWSPFITLSHSLLLWPLLLLGAALTKQRLLKFFAMSGLLHVTLDFFVHHDDAYRHFWPLSDWKFMSPISYWDPAYFGNWVGLVDTVFIIALLTWLWSIYKNHKKIQYLAMGLVTMYVVLQSVQLFLDFN